MLDFDLIETSESVQLERRLAGIGSRAVAGMVDSLILAAVYLVLALVSGVIHLTASLPDNTATWWVWALLVLVFFVVYWGYYLLFEILTNGQSPGKRVARIRVVQLEGGALAPGSVVIRNLMRAVDFLPAGYALGLITMFISKKSQRLGDLAAGTVVVSEEVPNYSAAFDRRRKVQDREVTPSAALQATGLTPREYEILHSYWIRRGELTIEARAQLLPKLAIPILDRIGHPLPNRSFASLEQFVDDLMSKAQDTPPQDSTPP